MFRKRKKRHEPLFFALLFAFDVFALLAILFARADALLAIVAEFCAPCKFPFFAALFALFAATTATVACALAAASRAMFELVRLAALAALFAAFLAAFKLPALADLFA
jgi:hypothetical protein